MFYYVLQCLVSCTTIGIANRAAADRIREYRDRENDAGIGDNSTENGNDAAGPQGWWIVDSATKVIPC